MPEKSRISASSLTDQRLLDRLEEIAAHASPGQWFYNWNTQCIETRAGDRLAYCPDLNEANAEFINAFGPAVILNMLEMLKFLQKKEEKDEI